MRLSNFGPLISEDLALKISREGATLEQRLQIAERLSEIGDPLGPALRDLLKGNVRSNRDPNGNFLFRSLKKYLSPQESKERFDQWLGALTTIPKWSWAGKHPTWSLKGGWLSELWLDCNWLAEHALAIANTWPLEVLRVEGRGSRSSTLPELRLDAFSHLSQLSLKGLALSDPDIDHLASIEGLSTVRTLDLSHNLLGVASLETIAGCKVFANLNQLGWIGNNVELFQEQAVAHWFRGPDVESVMSSEGLALLRKFGPLPWLSEYRREDLPAQ